MIPAPRWTSAQLEEQRRKAIELFRTERLEESAEDYPNAFDRFQTIVEDILEATVDLSNVRPEVLRDLLAKKENLHAFRYFSGPPISEDDLEVLADAPSLSAKKLRSNYGLVEKVTHTIMSCLDRRRFPWIHESRPATEAERIGAVSASAGLIATQFIQTGRRNSAKKQQEQLVEECLNSLGFRKINRRKVATLSTAPAAGEYCLESVLGTRKADFIAGIWDGRTLGIECKVSNSAINSVKRLNGDAGSKAASWLSDLGSRNVVPIAILSGVYDLSNLEDAQERGLALFWTHSMSSFAGWISQIKPPANA
jgi:hypothetical protein